MVALAKKKGEMGDMDIDFSELYDQEDDIYYVTFKTGEPSYVVELDDVLVLEVGMFTNMPTGFRILNFKKSKVGHVKCEVTKVLKKTLSPLRKQLESNFRIRTEEIGRSLDKVFA